MLNFAQRLKKKRLRESSNRIFHFHDFRMHAVVMHLICFHSIKSIYVCVSSYLSPNEYEDKYWNELKNLELIAG